MTGSAFIIYLVSLFKKSFKGCTFVEKSPANAIESYSLLKIQFIDRRALHKSIEGLSSFDVDFNVMLRFSILCNVNYVTRTKISRFSLWRI